LLIDGVIFCTRGVKESYEKTKTIFLQRKKIALITNCIKVNGGKESELYHKKIRKDWKINEDEKILTNVGYFNKQKGQIYLLDSMKNVLSELPQVKLFLVGWGPLETTLRMKARELGIADNIIFAGKCQQDRVFEILSITDIFVLSSLWEGFGLVLGEAMAMAKPVVCTKTDGSQVVVKHNETGIIVPPKDPRALADAVIDLIGDPDRARKMGELGKERVAALFSPERFIQEHEAFYREII
jgi:glycosyltransferase involved in cell wall biosynthesis